MEQNNKRKPWQKWTLFFLILTIIILIVVVVKQEKSKKLEKAKTEKQTLTKEKDSLVKKRDSLIFKSKQNLKNYSIESKSILKTIQNEKIYDVNDTTYNAMCEYITNYKPNN